ncbi:MAG TPA: DASS family sodium-coupled anion symporter [Clostridiales bacterium]|jgi:sodium-dependent dicarboxylate transporter 2/3/5|nr:DASS family sodium-coupled anion symporter [Clostridiales bacterium]
MENLKTRKDLKSIISFFAAVFLVFLSRILPLPEGLTREGLTSIVLLVAAIVLWVTEAMDLAAITIMIVATIPFFKIMPASSMFSSFAGSVFFFVLATFALTAALASSTLPTRIAGLILRWSGQNSKKLVIGFTLGTAILSAIMSNVPTCALFASLAIAILKTDGDPKPGTSRLGKALMIGVPAGSVIGGFITPAGGPTNVLAIEILEKTGYNVTFLDWMIIGLPLALISCIIVSVWLGIVFRPEPISEEALEKAKQMVKDAGPMSAREKKMLVIIFLMFVFWISSTWVPAFNTTLIALLGMCAFFLPGVRVLTWDQFTKNSSWDALFMIGGVGALAQAILDSGAATWLVNTLLSGAASWSPVVVYIVISAVICVLHILIPSGPAVAGLAVMPMILFAESAGVNPIAAAVLTAFWGGVTFMLPMDAVPMLTYGYGYYKIPDMLKFGWLPSIVIIVIAGLFIPFALGILGY